MEIEVGTFMVPRSYLNPQREEELWTCWLDRDHLFRMSRAAERADFDFVLSAYNPYSHDSFSVAQYALDHTKRLRQVIAHRPGLIQPTVTARMLSTLGLLSEGRASLNIVTGGFKDHLETEGDFLEHDERYARTDEYLEFLKRIWTATEVFDFEGEYYRASKVMQRIHPIQYPPIYFGGASEAAKRVAARHCDVYMMWGEPLAPTKERLEEMKALAASYGRELRYNISFRSLIGRTESEAWDTVERMVEHFQQELDQGYAESIVSLSESVGQRRLYDYSCGAEVLDERLFMGFTRLIGAQGNSSTLVGTVDQIVESLLAYMRLGISSFVLRGWADEPDAPEYTVGLVQALRRAAASIDVNGDSNANAEQSAAI